MVDSRIFHGKDELIAQAHKQEEAYRRAKKQLVTQSFWEFCVEVMGWPDMQEGLHDELAHFLQNPHHNRKLILLPRGHLKSTIATVSYSLWRIAKDPKVRILIANATYEMACTFLSQIKKQLQYNTLFIELFGNLADKPERWSENSVMLRRPDTYETKENTLTAFGIGGNLVSQHYDIIIMDDVVNRDNIHTSERIEDVHMFYKDALDLLDNPSKSEVIIIGTRWHEADLYGTLLDEYNPEHHDYAFLTRTAVEGDYAIEKRRDGKFTIAGGDLIFPKKFQRADLDKLINGKGVSEFSSQYLNDPVPAETAIFRHEFKYYEPEDLKGVEFNTFITVDPAFYDPKSRTVDTDYSGIIVNDVNAHNDWFIKEVIRQRYTPNELIELLFLLDSQYKPKTIGLESTSWQKILGYVARQMMREKNHFLPITELKHAGPNAKSKAERIQSLEPRYAVGSIWHNKNAQHIAHLEMELRRFPRAKHDDLADALASQQEIAVPPRRRTEREDSTKKFMLYPA